MTVWQFMSENCCLTLVLALIGLCALEIMFAKPSKTDSDEGGGE